MIICATPGCSHHAEHKRPFCADCLDNHQAKINAEANRLADIEAKLIDAGLDLDELIELITARKEGRF